MRFGPFEIVRPLGRGGMAETFLALWPGHEGFTRQICLKRVLAERAAEPDFVLGFQREAKLAARLVHPHIAQVYDFGCEGDAWWMALEHVPGGDLRAFLKALGQPLPADLGLVLMVDMLEALGYAHELGIVHRDVSPSNILVDLQGNFKLADFGIAKARHVDKDGTTAFSTTTGTIKGKAAYMAPEQALGLEVDGRADLWSFGVVMFEAFSGQKPFEGPTDLAIMMAANQGRRPTLTSVAPHVPADVAGVIERLLTPNRDARFQSAGDVLEALSSRPAPVQGRRRIAAMLQAIAPARASDAPDRTIVAPPSHIEGDAAAPSAPPAPGVGTTSVAPPPAPLEVRAAARSTGASRLLPLAAGALFVAAAAAVAALVWIGRGELPASTPSARAPSTSPSTTSPAPASVAPTTVVAVTPSAEPIARGVLVPDETELPPVPEASATVAADVRPRAPATERRPPPSAPRAPTEAAERGSLHVTVIPWGDVTIDGTPRGRSPLTVPLTAGTHRVRIESESGAVTREVRITAGTREELEVDLSGG